jgi:hypothetical protein
MGSHCSFGHLKHKLWPKEGPGVELPGVCQFWLSTLKVGNRPEILSSRQRATYCWKALDKSYNFAIDRTSIRGLLAKLWGSKVPGVPQDGISGLPAGSLGSPGKKNHLDVVSAERRRQYYKGEGGGFPQVRAVVNLVCPCCPWLSQHQRCSNYALTTLCGLCASPCEWISLSILPSPIPELQHAPLPLQVLWARERISTPPSSVVFHLDSHLSPSRSWECITIGASLCDFF